MQIKKTTTTFQQLFKSMKIWKPRQQENSNSDPLVGEILPNCDCVKESLLLP